ncbi:hypothetical protein TNCV_2010151 [Trichonephila clavipes]|nr:hypothetical protein TNCV_2010151 [Trichonephila clavipes]
MWTRASFYRHLKKHLKDRVCCPECREGMTMEHFYYKHASQKHGLEARQQCVFCWGRHQWAYGQKNRPDHVHHVVSCLERFAPDVKDVWAFSEDEEEEEMEEV